MSQLEFVLSPYQSGLTLISRRGTGSRETGVHLPKPHHPGDRLNVLLWFHGFYVKDIPALFATDGTRIRDIVEASGKDLVVIAPHMGHVDSSFNERDAFRKHSADIGTGSACEDYLDEVLDAMAPALPRQPASQRSDEASASLDIENLYIGCHSGGGIAMKTIVGGNSLGKYKSKLKQCWGFDCIYGLNGWEGAVRNRADVKFYLYYGRGTSRDAGGTPVEFWNVVYGRKKASNVYLAPCFPGVEDDSLAFQSVDEIRKKKDSRIPYEMIRRDVDRYLGDSKEYWRHVRKSYWHKLKDHYPVSADLLGPRIAGAFP